MNIKSWSKQEMKMIADHKYVLTGMTYSKPLNIVRECFSFFEIKFLNLKSKVRGMGHDMHEILYYFRFKKCDSYIHVTKMSPGSYISKVSNLFFYLLFLFFPNKNRVKLTMLLI